MTRRTPEQEPTGAQPAPVRVAADLSARPVGLPDRPPLVDAQAASSPGRVGRRRVVVHHVDPWSVFVFSFVFSVLLAVALLVAAVLLEVLLGKLGVLRAVNDLVNEVRASPAGTAGGSEVLTTGRILGGAAVLAAVDVVLVTAVSTVLALLYNACVSLTGGIEVTVGEAAAPSP